MYPTDKTRGGAAKSRLDGDHAMKSQKNAIHSHDRHLIPLTVIRNEEPILIESAVSRDPRVCFRNAIPFGDKGREQSI